METYNSFYEIARADFFKRGWSVNPLHRLPHEDEFTFRFDVTTTPRLSILVHPVVAGTFGEVAITLKLYLENGGIVVESTIPPRRRLLLPDVEYPTHTYRLDTQDLPVGAVMRAWEGFGSKGCDVAISPTKGIFEHYGTLRSVWLFLDDLTDGDVVRMPSEIYTTPPAQPGLGLRAVLYELQAICKCYLEQTTEFGKVVWLQYLIAKFCNFYCSETNEITRKTLLHILSTKVDFQPTVRSDGDHWYVLDLDNGVRYRFCRTHHLRMGALGTMPSEELDEKFPSETLRTYVHGTLVAERRLSQYLDDDFHNLVEYAKLPDNDALTWDEFCKLHYGEYGFSALVESRPEYQLVRRLNKEKK